MRHFLKFYYNLLSKHHSTTHLHEPNPAAEYVGQWVLGDTHCCVPDCNTVPSPSKVMPPLEGKQTNDTPVCMPWKTGPSSTWYSQYILMSTGVNTAVHAGWEDTWKEQLSAPESLQYFCSLVERTCSSAQHPVNRCLCHTVQQVS